VALDARRAADTAIERIERTQKAVERAEEDSARDIVNVIVDQNRQIQFVRRDGQTMAVQLPDHSDLVREECESALKAAGEVALAAVEKGGERVLELAAGAKPWDGGKTYEAGSVVSCYIGRTYIAKCIAGKGEEPGDNPEVWKRFGEHGIRVLKSKPDTPQAGDLYAENGAHFLHDGINARLVFPSAVSAKDVERAVRPALELARALQAKGVEAREQFEAIGRALSDAGARAERIETALGIAAKDASAAMEIGTSALADAADAQRQASVAVERAAAIQTVLDAMSADQMPDEGAHPVRRWKGYYDQGSPYEIGDMASWAGSLYLSLKSGNREPLSDRKAWGRLAKGGGGGGGGGGGSSGAMPPTDQTIYQSFHWVPGQSNVVSGGTWVDSRLEMAVVQTRTGLSDPAVLPRNQLATGKLVYVMDEARLYEYIVDAASATGTITDWRQLVSGVTFVGRIGDLPQSAVNGQMFVVRMDLSGHPLYRLATWEDAPFPVEAAHTITGTIPAVSGAPITLRYTMGVGATHTTQVMDIRVDYAIDGNPVTRQTQVPVGASAAIIAATVQQMLGQGSPLLTVTHVGDTVTIEPTAGHTLDVFDVIETQATGRGWRWLNRQTWVKALHTTPDQATDQRDGDLQMTTETNAREIKVYSNGAWHNVLTEAEIKAWIAAGTQFQGTVEETGHGIAGAVDLVNLPAQTSLGAGDKSHYWIWVGTANYQVPANGIGGAASTIDGTRLNVGDWLIVSEPTAGTFQYNVIPGDLMSRSLATQMFSLRPWTQAAWPTDSVVVYQGDAYRASAGIAATDGAPDSPGTSWVRVDISGGVKHVSAFTDLPTTAPAGTVYLVLSSAVAHGHPAFYLYDTAATQWVQIGGSSGDAIDMTQAVEVVSVGVPVGTIITYCSTTPPPGFLLCDGAAFSATQYAELAALLPSHTVPDLRGQFIRGHDSRWANASTTWAVGTQHQDTTRMPRSPFTATAAAAGMHKHEPNDTMKWHNLDDGSSGRNVDIEWGGGGPDVTGDEWTKDAGQHTHAITISGGDSETAPPHVIMAYMIKAQDATMRIKR
jgi:hypothetical protein